MESGRAWNERNTMKRWKSSWNKEVNLECGIGSGMEKCNRKTEETDCM